MQVLVVRSNVARESSHPFYEALGYKREKTQHVYRNAAAPVELSVFSFLVGKWDGKGRTRLPDGSTAELVRVQHRPFTRWRANLGPWLDRNDDDAIGIDSAHPTCYRSCR